MPMDPIVKNIVNIIANGSNVIMHGPGGTGKTYYIKKIANVLISKGYNVAVTATTGIAAVNLSEDAEGVFGSTVHSWSGIGIPEGKTREEILGRVLATKKMCWNTTDVLIIDEISMAGASLFDLLDFIGRAVRGKYDYPFGGMQLILCGDLLQLPPVNDKWCFESDVWSEMEQYTAFYPFTECKRFDDTKWYNILLRIRKGEQTQKDLDILESKYNSYKQYVGRDKELLDVKPTILHSRRLDTDTENYNRLQKLPGEEEVFECEDCFSSKRKGGQVKKDKFEKTLENTIPQKVVLKVGAQVMLKANLNVRNKLVNGSRGVVLETGPLGVLVLWKTGEKTTVAPYTWKIEDKESVVTRTQIPLILAWSLTIHKVQGCTLDYVVCNLGKSVFCAGQAYVALSRVRSLDGLFLSEYYSGSIKVDEKALGYVSSIEA